MPLHMWQQNDLTIAFMSRAAMPPVTQAFFAIMKAALYCMPLSTCIPQGDHSVVE